MNPNRIYNYSFKCLACNHKWSIESTAAQVQEVFPNFCPNCGVKKEDGKIEWQFSPPKGKKDINKLRKANKEYSKDAIEQATIYAKHNPPEPTVEVKRPPGPVTRYGHDKEKVPKKTVDTLKEKGKDFLEKNL